MIVIHNDDHQHALKEVDGAAAAVASDQTQAFRILKYILEGSSKVVRTALIFGSSGLVGGHLLNQLIKDTNYSKIKLFVRSVPEI